MRPIVTALSDVVLVGPPEVGDLHGERVNADGLLGIRTIWTLTDEERDQVATGRNIALTFWGRMPPVSLDVATADEVGTGEDDAEVRRRLKQLQDGR
jgi:hypothetical protein